MVEKGRLGDSKGSANGRAKLTERDVRDIRAEYATGHVKQQELAERYGITRRGIKAVVNRQNWSHVS